MDPAFLLMLLWSWRRADAAKSHAELRPDAVVVRLAVCQVVSKTDSPSLIIEPLCSKIGQVLLLLLWYRLMKVVGFQKVI